LMGITKDAPKLAKAYRNLRIEMLSAAKEYASDVSTGQFPGPDQTFH
jgi:3-methyl-2-oxobutanoate hydroxymethyltransferase